jgi:hypothetical protein
MRESRLTHELDALLQEIDEVIEKLHRSKIKLGEYRQIKDVAIALNDTQRIKIAKQMEQKAEQQAANDVEEIAKLIQKIDMNAEILISIYYILPFNVVARLESLLREDIVGIDIDRRAVWVQRNLKYLEDGNKLHRENDDNYENRDPQHFLLKGQEELQLFAQNKNAIHKKRAIDYFLHAAKGGNKEARDELFKLNALPIYLKREMIGEHMGVSAKLSKQTENTTIDKLIKEIDVTSLTHRSLVIEELNNLVSEYRSFIKNQRPQDEKQILEESDEKIATLKRLEEELESNLILLQKFGLYHQAAEEALSQIKKSLFDSELAGDITDRHNASRYWRVEAKKHNTDNLDVKSDIKSVAVAPPAYVLTYPKEKLVKAAIALHFNITPKSRNELKLWVKSLEPSYANLMLALDHYLAMRSNSASFVVNLFSTYTSNTKIKAVEYLFKLLKDPQKITVPSPQEIFLLKAMKDGELGIILKQFKKVIPKEVNDLLNLTSTISAGPKVDSSQPAKSPSPGKK